MNETERNDYVRETLKKGMPDDIPAAVRQRMENQFIPYRERWDTNSSTPNFLSLENLSWNRLRGSMAIGTAVIVVAAIFISQGWQSAAGSVAWADVIQAVTSKPWLHTVETWEDGARNESWYSANQATEGSHFMPSETDTGAERYTWTDFDKKTSSSYFPDVQMIVRETKSSNRWQAHKFFSAAWGSAFISGETVGNIREGNFEVVDQRLTEVMEGGKLCFEYRFRWSQTDKEEQSVTQFVVFIDPETLLPFRMDLVIRPGQKPIPFAQFDYPADGPADLYALGVPKTAEIVDCSLRPDVEMLAKETVAAGRNEDIEFSALIVSSLLGQHSGYRASKKGLCWRIDRTVGPLSQPSDPMPTKEADLEQWWRQETDKALFAPRQLFDGKSYWEFSAKTRRPHQSEIDAGADKDAHILLSNEKTKRLPWPRDYYWLGSPLCLMGHPTTLEASSPIGLPIYSGPWLATINENPKDGPPDTTLLELRNPTRNLAEFDDWRLAEPQIIRCWIDRDRDHLVMRFDELITQGGKEKLIGGFAIEGLTQDPRKRWLPTVVRQRVAIKPPDNEKELDDYVLRFFYDFDTHVSDVLFKTD